MGNMCREIEEWTSAVEQATLAGTEKSNGHGHNVLANIGGDGDMALTGHDHGFEQQREGTEQAIEHEELER